MGKGIAVAGIWIGTGMAIAFGEVNATIAFVFAFVATAVVAGAPWQRGE